MAHCSTYLVCSAVSFQGSRNLDQTGDIGATDAGTCAEFFKGPYNPEEPVRLAIPSMVVAPGLCTDVAGSQRVLQGTRQVAFFTRIQLICAGIDLMNTAYNYLDLAPKGRDEGGGGQFWVRRHNEYED